MTHEEMMRALYPKELQEAEIFALRFQASDRCLDFRKAWDVPEDGFKTRNEYVEWQARLNDQSNKYIGSENYQQLEKAIREKKLSVAQGFATDTELKWLANRAWKMVPVHKFSFDVGQVAIQEGKPEYMCDFVEQCLLFKKPDMIGIIRPTLKPKLVWDDYACVYSLVIENVFPDTTTKDFDDPWFTRELRALQKKMVGYTEKKARKKSTYDYGIKLRVLDERFPAMTDAEKADEIFGDIQDVDFAEKEKRRKATVRQLRRRMGKK